MSNSPPLQVRNLFKAFGPVRAVDGVAFEVQAGEIYGLLGPNGAGKTTTLSMVCGLLWPESGDVLIEGQGFWSDPQSARRIMGVVPQDIALYEELTGRENLEFWGRIAGLSAREAKSRAARLLEALALTDRANDPLKKYSGGMKRRINLGSALLHRPRLLLLDEPTVGIDPQARASLLEFVRTTSRKPRRSAIASASSTMADSWPKARSANSNSASVATACLWWTGTSARPMPTTGPGSATRSGCCNSPNVSSPSRPKANVIPRSVSRLSWRFPSRWRTSR